MLYPGCPDVYQCHKGEEVFQAFWYDGEFWLRQTRPPGHPSNYFDDVNELLLAMLQIAPYKDWENLDLFSSRA